LMLCTYALHASTFALETIVTLYFNAAPVDVLAEGELDGEELERVKLGPEGAAGGRQVAQEALGEYPGDGALGQPGAGAGWGRSGFRVTHLSLSRGPSLPSRMVSARSCSAGPQAPSPTGTASSRGPE
jgi:hypothetical protein